MILMEPKSVPQKAYAKALQSHQNDFKNDPVFGSIMEPKTDLGTLLGRLLGRLVGRQSLAP